MKFLLIGLLYSLSALSEDLSIVIEHPQRNNRPVIRREITCDQKCQWKSSTSDQVKQGTSSLDLFSKNLQLLHNLILSKPFTASQKQQRETYVNITIPKKSISLGHARHYKGNDLKTFHKINDLITKLEFNIMQEEAKK